MDTPHNSMQGFNVGKNIFLSNAHNKIITILYK